MSKKDGPAFAAEKPLALKSSGDQRVLSERFFGVNAPTVFYERLLEMPKKHPLVKDLAPGHLRFPGGTIANYYDWQEGLIRIPVNEKSSQYSRIMANIADRYIRNLHEKGVHISEFTNFSRNAGAEVMLVINLETSTAEDQAAWFKDMKQKGIVPRYIELGNEFWIAMVGDPNVMKKFPDVTTSMNIMKQYLEAIKPYLPDNAVIAAQSVGGATEGAQLGAGNPLLAERLREWDRNLKNVAWYNALTIHIYPEVDNVFGNGAFDRLPQNMEQVFAGMMALADEGTEKIIRGVSSRFPDKEIWISEWSSQGVRFFFRPKKPGSSGLMIHQMIRMNLTFLRLPEVTKSAFHMLSFRENDPYGMFTRQGDDYIFAGPSRALQWFHLASQGRVQYETLMLEGSERLPGRGSTSGMTYADVAAAKFTNPTHTTVLIHNSAPREKTINFSGMSINGLETAETFDTPDLMKNYNQASPEARAVEFAQTNLITVPAYSFTRLIWKND